MARPLGFQRRASTVFTYYFARDPWSWSALISVGITTPENLYLRGDGSQRWLFALDAYSKSSSGMQSPMTEKVRCWQLFGSSSPQPAATGFAPPSWGSRQLHHVAFFGRRQKRQQNRSSILRISEHREGMWGCSALIWRGKIAVLSWR